MSRKSAAPSRPPVAPVLIGPGITALAIIGMLLAARFYEHLPLKPPACGLREATGIPCLACGGTRSMMALARGNFADALAYNPLVFLSVVAALVWLVTALIRWRFSPTTRREPAVRRVPVWVMVTTLVTLFVANWLYLWFYLPPD